MRHVLRLIVRAAALPVGVVLGLSPCPSIVSAQAAAPASEAQATDSGTVVQSLIDAMRLNDGARIRSLFAPQASQAYGNGQAKSGQAFFAWLESDIIGRRGQVDDARLSVQGQEVIVTGQFHNSRAYRAAANFRFVVDNGRIVSWQVRY